MLQSFFLLFLLPFAIAKSDYCSGNTFKPTEANCAKFEFSKLKDDGQCTDSKRAANGHFHGIKLSNCTTYVIMLPTTLPPLSLSFSNLVYNRFYDISGLPNQSMDPKAVRMAELITNV